MVAEPGEAEGHPLDSLDEVVGRFGQRRPSGRTPTVSPALAPAISESSRFNRRQLRIVPRLRSIRPSRRDDAAPRGGKVTLQPDTSTHVAIGIAFKRACPHGFGQHVDASSARRNGPGVRGDRSAKRFPRPFSHPRKSDTTSAKAWPTESPSGRHQGGEESRCTVDHCALCRTAEAARPTSRGTAWPIAQVALRPASPNI